MLVYEMLDDHAHVMQVKLCKANTRGVTFTIKDPYGRSILEASFSMTLECTVTKTLKAGDH